MRCSALGAQLEACPKVWGSATRQPQGRQGEALEFSEAARKGRAALGKLGCRPQSPGVSQGTYNLCLASWKVAQGASNQASCSVLSAGRCPKLVGKVPQMFGERNVQGFEGRGGPRIASGQTERD